MSQFFNEQLSKVYDERNSKLAPISDGMHFLIRLILKDLPEDARILCVGVGTGAEILSLAKHHPNASFVGLDPSGAMLSVCRERLTEAGIIDRCELVEGYVQDVAETEAFDAVLSILVGHFVPHAEKQDFYSQMIRRVKKGGVLINTEISYDLDSPQFPFMLENWEQVQMLMGASKEMLANLPQTFKNPLSVAPPSQIDEVLQQSGLTTPVRFFQAFMITGWYGKIF